MTLLIDHPLLAAIIGVMFLAGYRLRRRRMLAAAASLWLLYAVYETGMRLRWFCSGECNIRIDLLVLYPLLAAVSLAGVVSFLAARSRDGG